MKRTNDTTNNPIDISIISNKKYHSSIGFLLINLNKWCYKRVNNKEKSDEIFLIWKYKKYRS